jgi:hypothetical protein
MASKEAFFQALDTFVNKPRDPNVIDRIKRFADKAQQKGLVTGAPVFREEEEIDFNPILAFFAPVGYRKLFEQEVLFLVNGGMSHEDVLDMPVHRRKALIKMKVKPARGRDRRLDEIPDMPPQMQRQMKAAKSLIGGEQPEAGD